jgi:pteridine reductase
MKGTALVTGGAKRVGEEIVRALHAEGWRVLVHCHRSRDEGALLVTTLNVLRRDSAVLLVGDLARPEDLALILEETHELAPDLSLLVNNTSAFFPTPLASATAADWDTLVNSNLRAPFFLAQGVHRLLAENVGSIVNLADIYAARPLKDHPVYAMTKAGLVSLTQSLARDLAPGVRVNAVSPGAILWPENASDAYRQQLLAKIPLQRTGDPRDIAQAVIFLAGASYITGHVLAVDGGRSLNI